MNSSRWQTISNVLESALDLPDSERRMFVQAACGGDADLEAEVMKLLLADQKAGSFLEAGPELSTIAPQSGNSGGTVLAVEALVGERFKILRFIGQGGMGQVYEAFDQELKCRVALKVIRPDIASDPRMLARFRREVQLTRMITHPNVCRTFDFERHAVSENNGPASTITFLTMELLEGETLSAVLRRQGRVSTIEAAPLVLQMIDALDAAHSVDVIHRDLKPANILLVPRGRPSGARTEPESSGSGTSSSASATGLASLRVVVTDFGLARAVAVEPQVSQQLGASFATDLTGAQSLMGTLVYMAPEQFERGETSVASDIYSLGLILFEMVTGQRPFADDIPFAEAAKRLKQPAPSARTLVPDLDPTWDAVISRCLAPEPNQRFQTVRQVGNVLVDLVTAEKSRSSWDTNAASSATEQTKTARDLTQRRRRQLIGVPAFLIVTVSLFVLGFRLYQRTQTVVDFAERDWILVTDFSNQTGERLFDRVVRDLVVQSLSQSSYVNTVPRISALEAAKRTGLKSVDPIDEKLGGELCRRENYKAMLSGSVLKNGSRYTIAVKIETPSRHSASFSDSETISSPEEVFSAVDRLTVRIRRRLGESVSKIDTNTKPLAQVTTNSLDALQRYSAAVDLCNGREFQRCIGLAKDAVDRDPTFAMAHLLLARAFEQLANDSESKKEFAKAMACASGASEREKHLILAAQYASNLQNDRAAQEYQHLLDLYPDDLDALQQFAIATFYAGHPEKGVAAQRRVLELNPNDPGAYDYLMELLVRTNQFDDALATYDKAKSRHLQTSGFQFLAALALWGKGKLSDAYRILASPPEDGSDYADIVNKLYLGKLLAFEGRLAEAEEAFQTGLGLSHRPGLNDWGVVFQYQLGSLELLRGQPLIAKREIRKYEALSRTVPTPGNLERAGDLAIRVGDISIVPSLLALIDSQVRQHQDTFSEMELHVLRGEIHLARGRPEEAAAEERSAAHIQEGYEPLMALAEACEKGKHWSCAIEARSRYLGMKGAILRYDVATDWVIAHYRLAQDYASDGNYVRAADYCRSFIELFGKADQGLPILLSAKRDLLRWEKKANTSAA